tara:strand:- start:2076 stop:3131 length:1056 start_codon:yes stop_codon:yes gene_type:complete
MELQNFIDTNSDYVSLFKKEGYKVVKYKNLILVKNYYDKPLNFKENNEYWKMYCRGVIIDKNTNKIVCLPPVKSIEVDITKDFTFAGGEIQYLIDGTMINLFYNKDQWLISTRGEIGGYNKWLNNKSFKQMFEECCDIDYNNLDKQCSYSFVMRHKENRNISSIRENEIYLVEVYKFGENIDRLKIEEYPDNIQKINNEPLINIENAFTNYEIKGYTIKEGNMRFKITNPSFEKVKELKPNMNNHLLNYIELRKSGDLKKYLRYFPEHSKLFECYRNEIHTFTNNLYNSYKDTFIFKKKDKKEIPYHFKPLLTEIHKNYLKTKNPTKWEDIKSYIHNLNSKRLIFALNYSK